MQANLQMPPGKGKHIPTIEWEHLKTSMRRTSITACPHPAHNIKKHNSSCFGQTSTHRCYTQKIQRFACICKCANTLPAPGSTLVSSCSLLDFGAVPPRILDSSVEFTPTQCCRLPLGFLLGRFPLGVLLGWALIVTLLPHTSVQLNTLSAPTENEC